MNDLSCPAFPAIPQRPIFDEISWRLRLVFSFGHRKLNCLEVIHMNVATTRIEPTKTAMSMEYKHDRPLTACHWEPKSRFIFFGAEDNLVHRYDVANNSVVSLAAHDSWVRSYGTSPDGAVLYSGGYDGRLGFWPVAAKQPEPIRLIDAHTGWLRAIAVSPDGRFVATCGNDLLVKLWNVDDGSLVQEFSGNKSHVYNLAFSRDSASLISCNHRGTVTSWSLESGMPRELVTVEALHKYDKTFRADIGGARGIALCGDGTQVGLGGITNVTNAFAGVGEVAIALVNLHDGKLERVMQSKDKQRGCIWGVVHHPDSFWIGLCGGSGGWLFFWKDDAENEFHKLKLKSDGRGMSISPDQTRIAVAHADRHLRIYALHETK